MFSNKIQPTVSGKSGEIHTHRSLLRRAVKESRGSAPCHQGPSEESNGKSGAVVESSAKASVALWAGRSRGDETQE